MKYNIDNNIKCKNILQQHFNIYNKICKILNNIIY